jgi:hypothetical protein
MFVMVTISGRRRAWLLGLSVLLAASGLLLLAL